MEPRPLDDPPNVAVFADRRIIEGDEWIAYVARDADDGARQFHTREASAPTEADAMLVALRSIVRLDRSVTELADLPPGWRAWRASRSAPWQRAAKT